jgi:hypothetical protein
MSAPAVSDRTVKRKMAVADCIAASRAILARDGVTRGSLERLSRELAALARDRHLFSFSDFPLPLESNPMRSNRYRLNGGDSGISVYAASMLPGKTTIPHNHGTWAVIAAITGEELNRVYRVTGDAFKPGHARLDLEQEIVVRPGSTFTLMPEDVHSIHVAGSEPALHIHMYGCPLEGRLDRLGYELETGRIVRYGDPMSKIAGA